MKEPDSRKPLFGATPQAGPPTTLREATLRARWIALDLEAQRFGVYLATAGDTKLTLCFDNEHPQTTALGRALTGPRALDLLVHARKSSKPVYWTTDMEGAPRAAPSRFAERVAAPALSTEGVAFPVYGDRGQIGLIVFHGCAPPPSDEALFDIHARCFALFQAVVALRAIAPDRCGIAARELECLTHCAKGMTSEEIAEALDLSHHTVNQYLTNVARKLGAVGRIHAVSVALRSGLIE